MAFTRQQRWEKIGIPDVSKEGQAKYFAEEYARQNMSEIAIAPGLKVVARRTIKGGFVGVLR